MASYAQVASQPPKEEGPSPGRADAPPPEESIASTTGSLIDVDHPAIQTVSSLGELDAAAGAATSKEEDDSATIKGLTAEEVVPSSNPALTRENLVAALRTVAAKLIPPGATLSPEELTTPVAGAIVGNAAAVVGLGALLSFSAWRLLERGRLGWQSIGVGATIVTALAAGEIALGRYYLYKKK